jgi:hypothetical protein
LHPASKRGPDEHFPPELQELHLGVELDDCAALGDPPPRGDRQLNRALHVIAITRARIDPQTKAYLERKRAEGKTRREALRSLQRHLARKIHRLLSMPAVDSDPLGLNVAISGRCLT